MTADNKKEQKRNEIIQEMKKHRDESGNIDLSKLRKENQKVYNKITYYFGSMDDALIACNESASAAESAKGAPLNRKILRNELAFDMLVQLRKEHTLQEIADQYGCSRAHINQLYQSLLKTIGSERGLIDTIDDIKEQEG